MSSSHGSKIFNPIHINILNFSSNCAVLVSKIVIENTTMLNCKRIFFLLYDAELAFSLAEIFLLIKKSLRTQDLNFLAQNAIHLQCAKKYSELNPPQSKLH